MFSLINLKADNIAPLIMIAAAAIGGYFLWTYAKKNNAAASAAANAVTQTTGVANANAGTIATLQALFGGSTVTAAQTATNTGQATYSAPMSQPGAAPVGNGSSVGNSPVTQGA